MDFESFNGLEDFCEDGTFDDPPLSGKFDMPLGNEVPGYFDTYQPTTPGGLPSPNVSNPDLPSSGRESPLLHFVSTLPGACGLQPSDGSLDANIDPLISYLPQQSQASCANMDSDISNNTYPSTYFCFSNGSDNSPEAFAQQWEPLMESSSCTNAGGYQTFTPPIEGPFCISQDSFQNHSATEQSFEPFDETAPIGCSVSTQVSNAPKLVNTSSASAAANSQHSRPSKSPHPSHLRNQIHPQPHQDSQFALSDSASSASQASHAMSSGHNFFNHQEPNASPSHIEYQNIRRSSSSPQNRRLMSTHNQNRGSPVSQNHQPLRESNLRNSITLWEAGQVQTTQYSDVQPISPQQANRSPYVGHHHVSGNSGNPIIGNSPEQNHIRSSDYPELSFISQRPMPFGFNVPSPMSVKREVSSPDSDHVASNSNVKSQMASPNPLKKRRVKQESKKHDDNEIAVDSMALQTTDLTNLSPKDQTSVMTLITAMHNTSNVEDNPGMQKTWKKVRKTKAFRIKAVCEELVVLTHKAHAQQGTPLGEKRSVNQYPSFEERFEALRETLTSQKTVCKHLIEIPFSYSVVDDPQYAKDRVKNNRRVNHQKAEAIRLGREHLGEKAQGKGRPMLKTKKRGQAQIDESDDEENSGDEPLSDGETVASHHTPGSKSARSNSHTPKRVKRSTNSDQHQEQRCSAQSSYSSQVQNLEDPFVQGRYQNAYAPTQQTHNQIPRGYAPSQQMPTLNQQYDPHSVDDSGNLFYEDNSTGGSDGEGYQHN